MTIVWTFSLEEFSLSGVTLPLRERYRWLITCEFSLNSLILIIVKRCDVGCSRQEEAESQEEKEAKKGEQMKKDRKKEKKMEEKKRRLELTQGSLLLYVSLEDPVGLFFSVF